MPEIIEVPEQYQVPVSYSEMENFQAPEQYQFQDVEYYDATVQKPVTVNVPEDYFVEVQLQKPI